MNLESKIENNEDGNTIEISKKEYNLLIASANKLSALESAGVDCWEGYDFAMEEIQNS